jgi:adenylate cyclase class 2
MKYEVEIKFRVPDHDVLVRRLTELGAVPGPPIEQEDAYLAHPGRDFARSDEALRLRRVGGLNRITYKGPKREGPTKTREEIEVPFADGDDSLARMTRLFERLGFRLIAAVRKTRRLAPMNFEGRTMEIALDLAGDLGAFAEVETLADENDLADAQQAVLNLAGLLGLSDVERRSYLRMTLEQTGLM